MIINIKFVSPSQLCTLFLSDDFTHFTTSPQASQTTDKLHKVTHFQYTSWPDHGVPLHPSSLVKFAQEVRKVHSNSQAPMVVHCRWGGVSTLTSFKYFNLCGNWHVLWYKLGDSMGYCCWHSVFFTFSCSPLHPLPPPLWCRFYTLLQ